MLPIGLLMKEHRLIERMIGLLNKELKRLNAGGKPRPEFIDSAVDFIRVYADKCHHGKEEDILFERLKEKTISKKHRKIMNELIEDHIRGRKITKNLRLANKEYLNDGTRAAEKIKTEIKNLVELYPQHIEKEDKHFFVPIMEYFSEEEKDEMLKESFEFDQHMIHEKYETVVTDWEEKSAGSKTTEVVEAYNVVISGEAGQGLVTIGEILAKSLAKSGYSIVVTKSYQSRIRGGHNSFSIRFSSERIDAPQECIDLLVALNQESIEIEKKYLNKNGLILAEKKSAGEDKKLLGIPFEELAENKHINVVALGSAAALLNLEEKTVIDEANNHFGHKKGDESAQQNKKVIKSSYEWTRSREVDFKIGRPRSKKRKQLIMDGNKAIAMGAVSSGLKFYSFYPMTPATSIALNIIQCSDEMEIVVEQAEDEIAAINMAIGASYAGAPAMTGTSGGGFALMTEGVSLSAVTETPIVIAVAQRPSPATGLPTRTEQADLEFVLHGGHGEFPRVIFTPGSVEDCFHLTRKAFELAEKYQIPAFILTDQFLADSIRNIEPFELHKLRPIEVGAKAKDISGEYERFMFTKSGISPRLLPGKSKYLVVVDSDEHTEDGHITESFNVRKKMVDKRLKKYDDLRKEVVPPEFFGEVECDLLFVTWGSGKGSVLEASKVYNKNGTKTSVLFFPQVWPLLEGLFTKYLERAGKVVAVESNATAQMARLIRRETGFEIKEKILRYDGLPITPDYILSNLMI